MNEAPRAYGKISRFLLEGLWTDVVRLFISYFKNWFVGASYFWVALTLIKSLGSLYAAHPLISALSDLADCIIQLLALSFFILCFLNEEPLRDSIKSDFGQIGRLFAAQFVPVAGLGALGGWLSISIKKLPDLTFTPISTIEIALLVCLGIFIPRLSLIFPLIANRVPAPVHTWRSITKGKTLRLCGNSLMIFVMTWPLIFLSSVNSSILEALGEILSTGLMAAFMCASCRILYGEHIAAQFGTDRRSSARE